MYTNRRLSVIALLLVFAVVLSACVGQPEETTDYTEGSTAGQTESPAGLNTAEDFEKFIKDNEWYGRALGCIFEKPEDIPTRLYFYLGVGDYTQATGDELAFILDAFQRKNPNAENLDYAHEYTRLPVAKMNEVLTVLGVTVEDIKIPQSWVYYDKTDSYYFWVSDAYGVTDWSVTKVKKGDNGKVTVYWETDARVFGFETQSAITMLLTMQQQSNGSWRILSNVPQD